MVCCMELGARELGMHSAMGMEAGMAFAHARVGQHVRDARVPISRKKREFCLVRAQVCEEPF